MHWSLTRRRSLGDVQAQGGRAAQVDVLDLVSAAGRVSTWAISRTTRGSAPGTSISVAQISGTSWKPSLRAASAGNSAVRSGVAVKITLITSSVVSLLRSITSVTSSVDPGEDRLTVVGVDLDRPADRPHHVDPSLSLTPGRPCGDPARAQRAFPEGYIPTAA